MQQEQQQQHWTTTHTSNPAIHMLSVQQNPETGLWIEAMQRGLLPFLSLPSAAQHVKHKCNLCGLECDNSNEYEQHLNSHFDHRCPFCDYTSKTEGRLKRHVKDLHERTPDGQLVASSISGQNSESDDSSQQNQSSHAKQRISKCKQCGFVAETKTEFWEHSKTHIKQGKMLECPQCPFVTEYKHHLEYHLRNHFGSKPFKCSKCNYSCVNKSMLNSHMKSHSNVYQYRCEDCNYATKYCHSLKLHLRKYNHKPAVVLNPDGTPNPYPIIDVYGTRRGPRPKKSTLPGPQPLPMLQAPLRDMAALLSTSTPEWMGFPFCWPALDGINRDEDGIMDLSEDRSSPTVAENSEIDEEEIKSESSDWGNAPLDLSRSSPHSPPAMHSRSSVASPSSLSTEQNSSTTPVPDMVIDFSRRRQ